MGEEIADLPQQIGPAVLIDRDVVHIIEPQVRLPQTIGDGLRWKARPMLDAAEPLLLRGGDEHAVAHERGRGICVKGVKAEDDHPRGNVFFLVQPDERSQGVFFGRAGHMASRGSPKPSVRTLSEVIGKIIISTTTPST